MKLITKSLIALLGTMTLAMAPAMANAERVYFLVGVRHIFRIGLDRDSNLQQRIEIEKNYADGVATDRDTFQKNVDGGADSTKESDLLNDDLDRLADDRDKSLGAIFERADDMRDRHPELHIEGDGPYQVMGIDYHVHENVEVFERFVVYAPWPGYIVVGRPYGGWVFGIEYGPTVFFGLYSGWHEHYYHGERFHDGFYGHNGPVSFAPHGFIDRRPVVMYGGRVGGQVRTGGYGRSNGTSSSGTRSGGYGRSTGISSGGNSTGTQVGGFGRTTGGTNRGTSSDSNGTHTGGYGRSSGTGGTGSNDSSRTGGYGRSSGGTSNGTRSSGTRGSGLGTSSGSASSGSSSGSRGRSSSGTSSGTTRSGGGGSHSSGSSTDKKKGN